MCLVQDLRALQKPSLSVKMKWHSASAAAILASLSLADALSTRLAKRDDTIKVFKFRVSA